MNDYKISIKGKDYYLNPRWPLDIAKKFDEQEGFAELHELSQSQFDRRKLSQSKNVTDFQTEPFHVFRNNINEELCKGLIAEYQNNPDSVNNAAVLDIIAPHIFNEDVENCIKAYFESDYCVHWFNFGVVRGEDDTQYFQKWHCDGGPTKHLKIIVYLNDFQSHGSETLFLNKETTDKLKDIGYIFTNLKHRVSDLRDIAEHFNIHIESTSTKPNTGDLLLFNPFDVAHRGVPSPSGERYFFTACLLPSPEPRELMANKIPPFIFCQPFDNFANQVIHSFTNKNHEQGTSACVIQKNSVFTDVIQRRFALKQLVNEKNPIFEELYDFIQQNDPSLVDTKDISSLYNIVHTTLVEHLKSNLNQDCIKALQDLKQFEKEYFDSLSRYNLKDKKHINAVFWPNPIHPSNPNNKYEQLPFVQYQKIMDKNTPVGSAGSCFAFEIARVMQANGYNYVVTERNDNTSSGIIVDGYTPGDKYAKFSANYGILFNTPSFLQLAEKAFNTRSFEQLLVEEDNGLLQDPYRENVFFQDIMSYEQDYQHHIMAVKQALLTSKVFIITLGLNECWELRDGTVLSRNPRQNMFALVKHKTLSVQENIDNIQRFFDIVKAHNEDFKLVISVSPIPFLASGRGHENHVVTSNTHSKSVLRVAADELVRANSDIYYLPSYELVTECFKEPWTDDHRHVKPEVVEKVVQMFQEIFVH